MPKKLSEIPSNKGEIWGEPLLCGPMAMIKKFSKLTNIQKWHLKHPVPLLINIKLPYYTARPVGNLLEKDSCSISPDISHFCHFWVPYGPLVVKLLHILVEEVLSFRISGVTQNQTRIAFRN